MDSILLLISALCYGIAAGVIAYLVCTQLAEASAAKADNIDREVRYVLPVLLRLQLPLVPLFKPIASGEVCRDWRTVTAPKLWMAGFGESISAADFVGLRIVCIVSGIAIMSIAALGGYTAMGILLCVLLAIYPGVWLNGAIRRRHLSIMKALPNVLDLLTLSVEAGRDFLSSLKDILQRRKIDPLGEELLRTFQEIQLGRKRTEALRELINRVRQPELTSVINAVIQAEELGVSIGQLLRIQGDMLRSKRFTLAEKLANEAPVKIIPAIILFILPAVFVILIVPIGMRIAEVMQ